MGEVNLADSSNHEGPDGSASDTKQEGQSGQASAESSTFARCARCAKADAIDRSGGTLVCTEYNMRVNAEADEIPDDCVCFTPRDPWENNA